MKNICLIISCLVLLCSPLAAQSISVASFSLLENDLTANTAGTMVFDQNGEKCALIKVETTQTGFTFDVGSLGVTKTEQHTAEIWVYVPAGVKRISIAHQHLGRLNNYDLGIALQKAKTYRLILTTGVVTTSIEEAITNQFLLFQVYPANATVIVNDEVWPVNNGVARKYVPFGSYNYRIMAPDYFSESGIVNVNDPDNKQIVEIHLNSNFSNITIEVENNAEIWLNGEKLGNSKWSGLLGAGEYLIEARLAGHKSSTSKRIINPADGNQTIKLPSPTPLLGKLMINTMPDMAYIYIDGEKVGQTPLMIQKITVGTHRLYIEKEGYWQLSKEITILEGKTTVVEDNLEFVSSPLDSIEIVEVQSIVSIEEEPIEEEETDQKQIFTIVDQEPEFPGGTKSLMEFIQINLRYPEIAVKHGIQGRVTLTFVVEKDGSIGEIEELRSPSEDLTKEAIRVVQLMPKWKPGLLQGKPVRVKYMLPITFRFK